MEDTRSYLKNRKGAHFTSTISHECKTCRKAHREHEARNFEDKYLAKI